MNVTTVGTPNYKRLATVWLSILAARNGCEIDPETVTVELKRKEETDERKD